MWAGQVGSARTPFAGILILFYRLQLLAGFEAHGFAGRNRNFGPGARIAANSCLARAHVENPKSAQLNAIAGCERFLHTLKDGFDRHFGFGLGDAGPVHNFVDNFELDLWRLAAS